MICGALQGSPRVGCLGGGQLGRMMGYASHRLGVSFKCLDPQGAQSPAGQVVPCVQGSFTDAAAIEAFAAECDVLTIEIEHVNAQTLRTLQASHPKLAIHPSPDTIAMIQDKFAQKEFCANLNLPMGDFARVDTIEDAQKAGETFGYPFMLKSRLWSYDGKGNAVVASPEALTGAIASLVGDAGLARGKLYAEKWVPFVKELAVMVVRQGSDVRSYPVVETTQHDNICHTVLAPAAIPSNLQAAAQDMASKLVAALSGNGIFGVEMFLTTDNQVWLNEVAPRPHNSGHYTIEACETDQFENHLRAVASIPLGSPALKVGASWMLNLLGGASPDDTLALIRTSHTVPGAAVHWYGKGEIRKGRKVGHVTLVAPSTDELARRAVQLSPSAATFASKKQPRVGIIMGSDSDLPSMSAAAKVLDQFEIPYELSIVSAHRTPERMYTYAQTARARGLEVLIAGAGGAAHLPGMVAALTPLPVIGVPIQTKALGGMDSLLSIVQMPRGIPVATVAIGNAMNAGLLAVRMLGGDDNLTKMETFMSTQEQEVQHKIESMHDIGWANYLSNMSL
ncbi:hypothetical protein LEN26_006125 [Aphanomyces euteiches]|nr:hypothetical protein AeMF1_014996 [Aphanomyces euteiches]KAH9136553.1 hypothetical protein LEN26_006125 [Aphanomyces euteiches]KAH9194257.1 hypothetical protein AeNC1_003769 [Aphanomyces euteiches]